MVVPSSLTFLLVTKDYHTLSELTEALEEIGARFDFSSTAEAAREYIDIGLTASSWIWKSLGHGI